ncbi:DNA cytosine methyltransferase [Microbacterium sp.]|uniref:DNA cytosine methyltransferase n=1 Tax=Microbacterium sp. TaxID=51671 RepID=UPI003241DE55
MPTIYRDVWDGLLPRTFLSADALAVLDAYNLLIASPPCQTFSTAGKGAGRKALEDVLGLIRSRAWALPDDGLRRAAEKAGLDDRTALVLTPLAYVYRDKPRYIALEQVPTVLPVWEAIATVLRDEFGYSVATGIVNAEQHGVPQTRRRAILVARRDGGVARLPQPTHSRFYPRDPQRLDEGVAKWVSMAEALGWVDVAAEVRARVNDQSGTPYDAEWPAKRPALTVAGRDLVPHPGATANRFNGSTKSRNDGIRLSAEELAAVQSYPTDFVGFARLDDGRPGGSITLGGMGYRRRDFRPSHHPAPTVTEKARSWQRHAGNEAMPLGADKVGALQTFPSPFPFQGTKTKQFLQIGNAVPPLLAEAILRTFID